MKVLILTHYYPPELGAPQTRLRETARRLGELGYAVRVLTGPPHYPDGAVRPGYHAFLPSTAWVDGVRVTRLPMIPRRNGGFLERSIDQGSFALSAMSAVPLARWADVLVVESPPLFLGLTARFHRLISQRPYIFHVADPWPDFPVTMGALDNRLIRAMAYLIEDIAYRGAAVITTVTPGLVRLLDAKPGAHGRVRLIPNGVETHRFDPAAEPAAARRELGWEEAALTLVYAGSVGLAQGVRTLIDAVAPLAARGVVLHIVGDGYERASLEDEVRRRSLAHVRFEPPVPADRIPVVLAAADAILVALRRGRLYEHALPTKLLEGLAAGRPVIVSAAGDAASIVTGAGAGMAAPPEEPEVLGRVILELAARDDRAAMGRRARAAAEAYDRSLVVARLDACIREAIGHTAQ